MDSLKEREEISSIAKELVDKLEKDDQGAADKAILDLVQRRSQELYFAVGNLTRDVHDSITELIDKCNEIIDPNEFSAIATEKVPDARERLSYVMEKTEYASEKTVESITEMQPVMEQLLNSASELITQKEATGTFDERQVSELITYLANDGKKIQSGITNVLLAQQHQTLASQVVTKTFNLVQDIESKMVALISVAGPTSGAATSKKSDEKEAYGPAIGHEDDVVHGQEDVDDLLSSLGF